MDLFSQEPQIKRFMVNGRNDNSRVSLLLVEAIELLEKGYLCSRGRLNVVETLQAGLETKSL